MSDRPNPLELYENLLPILQIPEYRNLIPRQILEAISDINPANRGTGIPDEQLDALLPGTVRRSMRSSAQMDLVLNWLRSDEGVEVINKIMASQATPTPVSPRGVKRKRSASEIQSPTSAFSRYQPRDPGPRNPVDLSQLQQFLTRTVGQASSSGSGPSAHASSSGFVPIAGPSAHASSSESDPSPHPDYLGFVPIGGPHAHASPPGGVPAEPPIAGDLTIANIKQYLNRGVVNPMKPKDLATWATKWKKDRSEHRDVEFCRILEISIYMLRNMKQFNGDFDEMVNTKSRDMVDCFRVLHNFWALSSDQVRLQILETLRSERRFDLNNPPARFNIGDLLSFLNDPFERGLGRQEYLELVEKTKEWCDERGIDETEFLNKILKYDNPNPTGKFDDLIGMKDQVEKRMRNWMKTSEEDRMKIIDILRVQRGEAEQGTSGAPPNAPSTSNP